MCGASEFNQTKHLLVGYQYEDERDFDESNLIISLNEPVNGMILMVTSRQILILITGQKQRWKPGTEPVNNLLGTIRTLDRANGAAPLYCPKIGPIQQAQSHCSNHFD